MLIQMLTDLEKDSKEENAKEIKDYIINNL